MNKKVFVFCVLCFFILNPTSVYVWAWQESTTCTLTDYACSCRMSGSCASDTSCVNPSNLCDVTANCPSRAHATSVDDCEVSYAGCTCNEYTKECIGGVCRCEATGGTCTYSCTSSWYNDDGSETNGCENQKPYWYTPSENTTTPDIGSAIEFSVNWTDTEGATGKGLGINYTWLEWNISTTCTPEWTNLSYIPRGNVNSIWSNTTQTIPYQCVNGTVIAWRQYSNDSANRTNVSATRIIEAVDMILPTYSSDADDSESSVEEGIIVNISVLWSDDVELSNAVLRHNATGTWQNATWCSLSETSSWCNSTINTSGAVHEVCWNQWANDTANNWNNTMPENVHCFDVWFLSKVYDIILNKSIIYNGSSVQTLCKIVDNITNEPIQNYNVSFYKNESFLNWSLTNSSGYANVSFADNTTNPPENYNIKCNITDEPSLYYNASSENSKNTTLQVVKLGVKASVSPSTANFGENISLIANVTGNASSITAWANLTYTSITNGKINLTWEEINLTYNNTNGGLIYVNNSYIPPHSGDYNVTIFVDALRISNNTTSFNVSFGQSNINFVFPNYRVMINQTFNISINLSATNGDIWYTNLTLDITNKSVINITLGENFYHPYLYNVSNSSSVLVNWTVSSENTGLTSIVTDAIPINGSSTQENDPHKVIYPILLATPNITNITVNTTLRTKIVGNTTSINVVNLTIDKAYSSDTDYVTSVFSQNTSETACTGEVAIGKRVTLLSEDAYSNNVDGNKTINNDYEDSWAGAEDLIIILNGTYTIEKFSIYWKNVSGTGNVTIYYNTSSGWTTVSQLSELVPPVSKNFTNISAFSPFSTNAFNISHTDLGTQIFEFASYEVQPRADQCYIYDFNFSNTTRSGNYTFNASIQTQDSLLMTENSSFYINFGSPFVSVSAQEVMLTNLNYSYTAFVHAINGDLRNLTLNLTVYNTSILDIASNDTQNKSISEILNGESDSLIWTITTNVSEGATNTSVSVNSTTSEGSFNVSSNFTINVTAESLGPPNVTNFWFNYSGITTNKTNLYTNLIVYANVSDDVSLKNVKANITYPYSPSSNNISINVTMSRYSKSGAWETWEYTFGDSNLPLNRTGNYTIRIIAIDIGDQEKNSGIDPGSPENLTFYVNDTYTLNLTSSYSLYMRGENVTVQALDVNDIIVENVNWIVNITKINETSNFTPQSTTFNYTILINDTEGNYSIIANASKDNNTGNNTWNFDVDKDFVITDISVSPSLNPSTNSILNVQAYLNNTRGTRHTSPVSGSLFCFNVSNRQYTMFDFNFSNGFSSLVGSCISPSSYSTSFNITINVSDQNNTGQYIINLTTVSASSSPPGPGGGGGGFMPSKKETKNCTDGTLYSQCSPERPFYCSNGTLIENCSICGCKPGYGCQPDGSCVITKEEDFNFGIDLAKIEIRQGEDYEGRIGVLTNTGNTILNLISSLNVSEDCCDVSIPSTFKLTEKEKKIIDIKIHVPLYVNVSEYLMKIGIGTEYFKKEDSINIIVRGSSHLTNLSEMQIDLTNLEKEIQEYKQAGVDTRNLDMVTEQSKVLLNNANDAINNDQIFILKDSLQNLKDNIIYIRSSLVSLRTQRFLLQNAWLIGLLIVMSIATIYFVPEVFIPLYKIKNDIRKLKEEEDILISSRIKTEKQYFMRKIDEKTFSEIMTTKQDKILKTRAMISENEKKKEKILKTRLKPAGILRSFKEKIKSIPKVFKKKDEK